MRRLRWWFIRTWFWFIKGIRLPNTCTYLHLMWNGWKRCPRCGQRQEYVR